MLLPGVLAKGTAPITYTRTLWAELACTTTSSSSTQTVGDSTAKKSTPSIEHRTQYSLDFE